MSDVSFLTISILSLITTLATGLLLYYHILSPGLETWTYGIPFPWRSVISYSSQAPIAGFDWFPFSLDVLFYMAAGYVFNSAYQRRRRGSATVNPAVLLSITYIVLGMLVSVWLYLTYGHPH